ncbi:hypothetical protein GCM10010515_26870 [Streptomyces fructofermentans]|uniref:Uncharacterized protein n=1 Tax=Streptomyces fructofermentans TaxID=152141 RepID=A0A918KCS7_9ACTN|nr:hypothetical protein GCM10010515_26870 [Streptomyces fructofermentans]
MTGAALREGAGGTARAGGTDGADEAGGASAAEARGAPSVPDDFSWLLTALTTTRTRTPMAHIIDRKPERDARRWGTNSVSPEEGDGVAI